MVALNPVIMHARQMMLAISTERLGESGLTSAVQERVCEFLHAVTDRNSTYVSVVPDIEGVAVLHWVAGTRTVQVDVEETGATYLWVRDGETTRTTTDPNAIYGEAKGALSAIARAAAQHNPRWRESMRRA